MVGQDPGQALRVTDRIPDAGNLTGSLAFQEAQAAQEVGGEFLPAPVQEPSLQTGRDAPLAGWPAILLPLAAAWAARRRQGLRTGPAGRFALPSTGVAHGVGRESRLTPKAGPHHPRIPVPGLEFR